VIVRIAVEARAVEFRPGRWRAEVYSPSKRFYGRAIWVDRTTYLAEEVAMQRANKMLGWLERQTWMQG